jgi:RNA polymerase sigma factor (sigma-70 family)
MEFADDAPVTALPAVRARRATAADLGSLYAERGQAFAGVAASICGDSGADAVQDAFVRALTRVGTLRSHGALEPWVWKIVLNEARRRAAARPPADIAVEPIAANTEVDPRIAAVRAALSGLPQRQREVAFLRYFADLDEAAIAAALGIRRGTVAATLHHVHGRIRNCIEGLGVEP